ncbi:conserved exported hypothetical protein [Candidatus Terasakiella magnetica]|uniref:FecR protein domain-containing protein n=1 Tax=Candidatus Terasakiella magnetica TaxID=1867952 RepID=A0A1C3RHY1_9PROT|nr:FecR family protein [Candidatus Terasakiella magnetica]SCA56889.1 conserved exported hypothetical protein [Candidatus Terasakiella magnetica]
MRRFAFLACFISVLSLGFNAASANDKIGTTIKATGTTTAYRLNLIYAQRNTDPVFFGDELKTGASSRLQVVFNDSTELYLGDHSTLTIDELVYIPNQKGQALFSLSQGVFRMVSGAINKIAGSSFRVRTPLATIGVRGTDFWGHQTEDKLILALLDDGEVEISTQEGDVTLSTPLSAIVIEKDKPLGQVFQLSQEQVDQAKQTVE